MLISFLKKFVQIKFIGSIRRRLTIFFGATQLDAPAVYCKGFGLEIGASGNPYPFLNFKVDQADLLNESRKESDILFKNKIIPLIPPKCCFSNIKDETYDFVYAAHVLEHSLNPLRSLQEWSRLTREGGTIYISIPNKNKTYDKFRNISSIDFLKDKFYRNSWDFQEDEMKTMILDTQKYHDYPEEYKIPLNQLDEKVRNFIDKPNGMHHYSVFDPNSFITFIEEAEKLFNLETIYFQVIKNEMHVALKKKEK